VPWDAQRPPGSASPTREDFVAGLFAPLLGFVGFGALVGAGLRFRHQPEIHKRLMLLALLVLRLFR